MKILLFIGLKTVEVTAVVVIPYLLGRIISFVNKTEKSAIGNTVPPYWIQGILAILLILVIGSVFFA